MDALPVAALVDHLRRHLPALLAVYGFGSRVQGTAGADSDLDLAVLVAGRADVLQLWSLSGDLADLAGCPVDLIAHGVPHRVLRGHEEGSLWLKRS